MYIVLENTDYDAIASAIVDSNEEQGSEYVDIKGLELEVKFKKIVEGYEDRDYFNGTGEWICTFAEVIVQDIKYGNVEVDYNAGLIESIAEDMIKS